MKVMLINPAEENETILYIEDKLEDYRKYLECDRIDITTRLIGGKEYCIVCDDEGRFIEGNKVSASSFSNKNDNFVGKIIIANNGEEHLKGLNDADLILLMWRSFKGVLLLD